jgi:subtilisin-like proprotein convertase family protein
MDAHNAVQRIVAIVLIVGGLSFPVFAGQVHIYSGQFDLQIPANPDDTRGWMADAVIEIPDNFTIHDLDVRISITHTNVFDLQLFLRGPHGSRICLNYFDALTEYDIYPNYINTIFDDEAIVPIENGDAPFTGQFKPRGPGQLEDFEGKDTFGSWRLQIFDMWDWDYGTLDSFELIVTVPEPATAILLTLGAGLMGLFRSRRRQ